MKHLFSTILLLVSLSSFAQTHPRALRPSEIDPWTVYVFQWVTGTYTTVGGKCAVTAYFIIQETGEWVEVPVACEDGGRWKKGLCMNLVMPELERDSVQ